MNDHWEYVPFKQLVKWEAKSLVKSGDGTAQGKYKLFVSSDTEIKRYNDFLTSGDALVFGTGGNPSCHYVNEPFAYSTDCVVAKGISEEFYPQFYYYYFRMNRLGMLGETFTGSGLKHTSKKKIGELLVPVVSMAEQERIVGRIEELFSQLDDAVETLKKTKAQLAVYRQAVLKEAFDGDFSQKQLKEISRAFSGYAFKSSKYSPDGKYVVVKIGNVKERQFDFLRDLTMTTEIDDGILEKYLLHRGDCLITLTGSRGKRDYGFVAMIENQTNFLLNQRVAALRFDTSVALPEFFQYYLASPAYRDQFFGYETGNVGQGNVGTKALTEPFVVVPDLKTQKKIVEEIEARLSSCDSIEKTVDAALQQAEAMRQSILKSAFEGRL